MNLFTGMTIEYKIKKYLTKLKRMLILKLAGKDLPVILNCKVYDDVLEYNRKISGDILVSNCSIESIEKHIKDEAAIVASCSRKGITRRGNVYVLTHLQEEI